MLLFDLRSPGKPLSTIAGHQRAVSYVRHMGPSDLVSASTDNSIKMWDLSPTTTGDAADGRDANGGRQTPSASATGKHRPGLRGDPRLAMTYGGHVNERNFVGLSVTTSGEGRFVGESNNC